MIVLNESCHVYLDIICGDLAINLLDVSGLTPICFELFTVKRLIRLFMTILYD